MTTRIHPTAIIESGVAIGDGTAVWDNVHIREATQIGRHCIVGGKSIIAYQVRIGNRVKINSFVYICHGVTIEDGVMVGAHVTFTNDQFPRATTPDLQTLLSSAPGESTRTTLVREGASIGAGSTIGSALTIGRFAMVGMGSLVTQSVPDFHLVYGQPAHSHGCVCRCGYPLARFPRSSAATVESVVCESCGRWYIVRGEEVTELTEAPSKSGECGK